MARDLLFLSNETVHPGAVVSSGGDAERQRVIHVTSRDGGRHLGVLPVPLTGGLRSKVCTKYRILLNGLLALDEGVSKDSGAWILHNPESFDAETERAVRRPENHLIFASHRWFQEREREAVVESPTCRPGYPEGLWWRVGRTPTNGRTHREWLGAVRMGRDSRLDEPPGALLAEQMSLFACRIYLAPETAAKLAEHIDTDQLNALSDVLLRIPHVRSTGVSAGVIKEHMLVLRRFSPDPGASGELPYYLIVPVCEESCSEQEREALGLMADLTDLEASAAAQLFDVVTSLDVYASHLRVYQAVARRAEEFWDQLVLYLSVERGLRLIRIHRLIELVHQTLIQGITDLDQVAFQADKAKQTVGRLADELNDQFDRKLSERPLRHTPSIQSSLTRTGYFDKAERQAERVHQEAVQAQLSYTTLLEGIRRAFDEQRIRGTDVLQPIGITFFADWDRAIAGSRSSARSWSTSWRTTRALSSPGAMIPSRSRTWPGGSSGGP